MWDDKFTDVQLYKAKCIWETLTEDQRNTLSEVTAWQMIQVNGEDCFHIIFPMSGVPILAIGCKIDKEYAHKVMELLLYTRRKPQ